MSKVLLKKKVSSRVRGVIGIDEVGRGPLAGPVTLCACYVEDVNEVKKKIFGNTIRDSKKIKKVLRNNIYQTIRYKRLLHKDVIYATASRSAAYIDKHGISKAIDACIATCLSLLLKKGVMVDDIRIRLDAGLKVKNRKVVQSSHVRGDEQYVEIALASIVAKVRRDGYMDRLAKVYGVYGWDKNAGYGTDMHRKAIQKNGVTKYHRLSYLKGFKLFDKAE